MNSNVRIRYTKLFLRRLKPLLKKYPSLVSDLDKVTNELLLNPRIGESLGMNSYKIRVPIASKGKGKSGGARIISHIVTEIVVSVMKTKINLLTIYDKSEQDSVSKKEIAELIKNMEFDE